MFYKVCDEEGLPDVFCSWPKIKNKDKQRRCDTAPIFTHWNFHVCSNMLVRNIDVQFELCPTKGTVGDSMIWKVYLVWVTLFHYGFSSLK